MRCILMLILLIFLYGCSSNFVEIDNGDEIIKIKVEIAADDEERANGLMFREKLGKNKGMLFVYSNSEVRTFWMKNTLIPLDIIFISSELEIINIEEALPCLEDPCKVYSSKEEVKYVLEVNKGFTKWKNINVGDKVVLKI